MRILLAGSSPSPIRVSSRAPFCPHTLSKTNINDPRRQLLSTLGVPFIVDELWSLEADALSAMNPPPRALIFLFKWVAGAEAGGGAKGQYDSGFAGFFAHQTVNNACATLAVMNALGNLHDIEMGSELREVFEFSRELDPQVSRAPPQSFIDSRSLY